MNKENYSHLLEDQTLCHDLSDADVAGHHDLSDLASENGHASLNSCLNDGNLWGETVATVAAQLLGDDQ